MDEQFLQYVWFNRLYAAHQRLTDGTEIEVIDPGRPNSDAGPDAFNAKIRVGGTVWAGNVEIHCTASDWYRHGHESDSAYDSLLLHVVWKNDVMVGRHNGEPMPTLRLSVPEHVLTVYDDVQKDGVGLCRCAPHMAKADGTHRAVWIERCAVERMEDKARRVRRLLDMSAGDWERTFFVMLFRSFGFGTNSDAMEALAMSVPYTAVCKHCDSALQLEALFMGQAGLLDSVKEHDEYTAELLREYDHLRRKFSLEPVDIRLKSMRMRPGSFPAVRLAELAAIYHRNPQLFSLVTDGADIDRLRKLFGVDASAYWDNHFSPSVESKRRMRKRVSRASADIIVINTVVPFYFAYGAYVGNETYADRALRLLESIPPENNFITRALVSYGFDNGSALHSQGLIQMYRRYCEPHDCLRCHLLRQMMAG